MEAILQALVRALGWSIFHSLWQGAIIYGLLLLTFSLMAKKRADVKHNIAYLAMCLIFIGFCSTFFSLFKFPDTALTPLQPSQGIGLSEPIGLNFSQQLGYQAERLFPHLAALYTAGLLFQLVSLTMGYNRLIRLKKAAKQAVPMEWQQVFEQMLTQLKISRKVGFYLSEQINVPLVIGYLKPVVLFPIRLTTQLDTQQVEAILIHELSHIRRNDYLLNLIKSGIETMLFFNPFIWLSGKLINMEREHACDDLVLAKTGTPVAYAHTLLKLEILKANGKPNLSMAATGQGQHLYHRIKRITDMKTNYMNAKQQFFAITLGIATIISVAWISPEKTKTKTVKKVVTTYKRVLPANAVPVKTLKSPVCTDQKAISNPIDTTKKKKFKIVSVDEKGNQVAYDSLKEMPDSLRAEIVKETFMNRGQALKLDSVATLIFRAQNGAEVAFKQSEKNKEAIAKSIEAAKKVMEIRVQTLAEDKARAQTIAFSAIENGKLLDQLREKHDAQMQLENSTEYKKLKKKFDEDLEKIKKKKGIKTPTNFTFNYSYRTYSQPQAKDIVEVEIK